MVIVTKTLTFQTKGNGDMIDITSRVEDLLSVSGVENGIVTVFVPGSTASVTTIEYEPGLIKDFPGPWKSLRPPIHTTTTTPAGETETGTRM